MRFNHGIIALFLLLISAVQIQAKSPPPPDSQYQYAADFSPSMAILIVVLIAAMFFMGFFSVYIRYCSRSTYNNSTQALTANGRSRRAAARGLDPEVILTFPTFPYSDVKELKIGKGALECAVCLNEFEDDETLRLIPKCDHVFHPECIDEWLSLHTTCPVCRADLVPGESGDELTHESESTDVEAQLGEANNNSDTQQGEEVSVHVEGPEVISVDKTLNRNRTRRSRSGRPPKFPRSHSTGHSLVHPGENTDRFTLKLSVEARKQLMNRKLNRASSMFLTSLPRQGSSARGYRTGGEGSSRGRWLGRSGRWAINIPPFFSRSLSLMSPRVAANDGSIRSSKPGNSFGDSSRPAV